MINVPPAESSNMNTTRLKDLAGAGNSQRREKPANRALRSEPRLRFSPTAWAKLLYLRDRGRSEVGGFGISSANDLLLIEDVRLIQQHCTPTYVEFEDAAVADFFDQQID